MANSIDDIITQDPKYVRLLLLFHADTLKHLTKHYQKRYRSFRNNPECAERYAVVKNASYIREYYARKYDKSIGMNYD